VQQQEAEQLPGLGPQPGADLGSERVDAHGAEQPDMDGASVGGALGAVDHGGDLCRRLIRRFSRGGWRGRGSGAVGGGDDGQGLPYIVER
jgi:hypothetical protein